MASTMLTYSGEGGCTPAFHLGDTQQDRMNHLLQILRSHEEIKAWEELNGCDAQKFLDSTQELLEQDGLFPRSQEDELYHKACKLVERLSRKTGRLPASLFVVKEASKYEQISASGRYSDIYRCENHDGLVFAGRIVLKRLRTFENDKRDHHKDLCREALAWRRLHHLSVLEFLGIDNKTFQGRMCLISPFLQNGTVMEYRKKKGRDNFPIIRCVRPVIRVRSDTHRLFRLSKSRRVFNTYIHSERVLHGDLHTGNILIDDKEHVKLTDFGLACLVDATTTEVASSGGGVEGYIAPELYLKIELDHQATPYKKTRETEVFAFASVCYALYRGYNPLHSYTPTRIVHLLSDAINNGGITPWLLLPQCNDYNTSGIKIPDNLWELVRRGWGISSGRPLLSEFIATLQSGMKMSL
ncbi:kinase-like domain-containing protein [Mycena epipterygia]|nr:kinase-like domain-containing protein [Mycena epipterygia]